MKPRGAWGILLGLSLALTGIATATALAQYQRPPPPKLEPTTIGQPTGSPTSTESPGATPTPGRPSPGVTVAPTRITSTDEPQPSPTSTVAGIVEVRRGALALTGAGVLGLAATASILIGTGTLLVRRSRGRAAS